MQICEYLKNLNIFVYYIYQTNFNFMINNYDSVVACSSSGATSSQKQGKTSYTSTKRAWLSFVTVFVALFSIAFVQGQSTANYAFSTNTSGSLALDANGNTIDMSTGTTQMLGAGFDDTASSVFPMGFNYYGMGTFFNSFSANSNGAMRLGTTAVGTSGTTNGGSATALFIAPFGGDHALSSTGKIHYKIVGTAPNRTLVVEWLNVELNFSSSTGDGTFQVRLYETTGVIELVYGSMTVVPILQVQ